MSSCIVTTLQVRYIYRYLRRHANPGQVCTFSTYRDPCPHCNSPQAVITLSKKLRLKQSEGSPWGPRDEKVYYVNFLISSYNTNTKAPPMPLITLDQAPLKKAFPPSFLRIFLQQLIVPLYMMSAVKTNTRMVMRRYACVNLVTAKA